MIGWDRRGKSHYDPCIGANFEVIATSLIEPPRRSAGVDLLNFDRLGSILHSFVVPQRLPPIQISGPWLQRKFPYTLYAGCHRFYATIAAGFPEIPSEIIDEQTHQSMIDEGLP